MNTHLRHLKLAKCVITIVTKTVQITIGNLTSDSNIVTSESMLTLQLLLSGYLVCDEVIVCHYTHAVWRLCTDGGCKVG